MSIKVFEFEFSLTNIANRVCWELKTLAYIAIYVGNNINWSRLGASQWSIELCGQNSSRCLVCGSNILRAEAFKTIYEFNTLIRFAGFLRLRDILRVRTLRHSVNDFRLQGILRVKTSRHLMRLRFQHILRVKAFRQYMSSSNSQQSNQLSRQSNIDDDQITKAK